MNEEIKREKDNDELGGDEDLEGEDVLEEKEKEDEESDSELEELSVSPKISPSTNPGHVGNPGNADDDIITISKEKLWRYSTLILVVVIIVGAYFMFKGGGVTGNVLGNPSVPQPPVGGKVQVSADDDSFKGDKDAPVTIIEFTDYECPFCKKFYTQTLGQIEKEYIDTGKVKYVVRDFPLGFHPNAQKAAEAAECAGEQGGNDGYFKMHDKLFDNGVKGGVSSFKQFAGQIGLDTGKFNTCLDSDKMASEVQKDMKEGQSYGVQGTPAFFVNGKLISGAQPFSAFKQAIDAEL